MVTGASSGIGRAIAESYAAEGAVVLLTHRGSPERAREVADAIVSRGGRALVRQADLATRDACERLVAGAHDEQQDLNRAKQARNNIAPYSIAFQAPIPAAPRSRGSLRS